MEEAAAEAGLIAEDTVRLVKVLPRLPSLPAPPRCCGQCSQQNLPSKVLPFVMSSLASLTCSATPGKTAARRKMPFAGFPGSSNKVEGVLPRALRFCREHWLWRPCNACTLCSRCRASSLLRVLSVTLPGHSLAHL